MKNNFSGAGKQEVSLLPLLPLPEPLQVLQHVVLLQPPTLGPESLLLTAAAQCPAPAAHSVSIFTLHEWQPEVIPARVCLPPLCCAPLDGALALCESSSP